MNSEGSCVCYLDSETLKTTKPITKAHKATNSPKIARDATAMIGAKISHQDAAIIPAHCRIIKTNVSNIASFINLLC